MKEEHIFINCYNSKLNLCFSLKKLVSNYSLDILCVLEFATNRNAPKPSAGVPLTYNHVGDSSISIENLTSKFLETQFSPIQYRSYRKNGCLANVTLSEIFSNKYTNTSGEKLQVRAMNAEDIFNVTGLKEMKIGYDMNLRDVKYNCLFINGADYWLCHDIMWTILAKGDVNDHRSNDEFGVRPVVSLKALVIAESRDMIGAWNIEI